MIALALLFILIIGLLWIIVYLLERYFDAYGNVYTSQKNRQAELQRRLDMRKNKMENSEAEKQINAIIVRRLLEIEQKFPCSEMSEEPTYPVNVFTKSVKQLLHSTLNLLKSEHNSDAGR